MIVMLPGFVSVNPECVETVRCGQSPTGQIGVCVELMGGKIQGRNLWVFPEVETSLKGLYELIVNLINDGEERWGLGPGGGDDDDDDSPNSPAPDSPLAKQNRLTEYEKDLEVFGKPKRCIRATPSDN